MTSNRKEIRYALIGAGLMIGAGLAMVAARSAALIVDADQDLGARLFGVAMGLIVAFYGNVVPRRLVRYDPQASGPSRQQAILRISGWAFVLGGLGHAIGWLIAPSEQAALWAIVPLASALIFVLLLCARARLRAA